MIMKSSLDPCLFSDRINGLPGNAAWQGGIDQPANSQSARPRSAGLSAHPRRGVRVALRLLRLLRSPPGRFCCRSLLQAFSVGDSVAVMRFATGAGDDGAAESGPGAVFLFISSG